MASFYVAGSSSIFNAKKVQDLIDYLCNELGYEVPNNWVTTPMNCERCLASAVEADYMVVLGGDHSIGTMVEIGARLGAGKTLNVIGQIQEFWQAHSGIYSYSDESDFLDAAAAGFITPRLVT